MGDVRAASRPTRVLFATSALVAIVGVGVGVVGLVLRESARAHWREVSTHVAEPGYDADESDRRYLEVERWGELGRRGWTGAGLGALGLVASVLLLRRDQRRDLR